MIKVVLVEDSNTKAEGLAALVNGISSYKSDYKRINLNK